MMYYRYPLWLLNLSSLTATQMSRMARVKGFWVESSRVAVAIVARPVFRV